MNEISASEYSRFIKTAQDIPFCRVYPMSVTEGIQSGCIYTNESESLILIRHRSNFTFMSGTPNEDELLRIHELILSEKLKLLCQDNSLAEKLMQYGGVELIPRDIYRYPYEKAPETVLPYGYTMRSIDEELFNRLSGRVSPSYYWNDYYEYSRNGKGICIMHGNKPASWAFLAASSSTECDIGIETDEAYRRRGLAYTAAAALMNDILPDKRPVWTCQHTNRGSARTAEKLGFVKCSDCILIRRPLQA